MPDMQEPITGPDPDDVAALTDLLSLMQFFPSNEQRARYLLSSDWMRDRGAAAAEINRLGLGQLQQRAVS